MCTKKNQLQIFMDKIVKKSAGSVYIGSDNDSHEIKQEVKTYLERLDFLVIDLGVFDIEEPCDYTIMGREVAEKVLDNQENCEAEDFNDHISGCEVFGVLLNYTGLGMYTAADAVNNVEAAFCRTEQEIEAAKKKGALVLSLNTENQTAEQIKNLVHKFVTYEN
jgi:ribose 5-phosphate isomerase RpiB